MIKEYNRQYYVLKVPCLNIYFNCTRADFYIKERWFKNDENDYVGIQFAMQWNIEEVDHLKSFLKAHKNLDKNFKIFKVSETQNVNYEIKKEEK